MSVLVYRHTICFDSSERGGRIDISQTEYSMEGDFNCEEDISCRGSEKEISPGVDVGEE